MDRSLSEFLNQVDLHGSTWCIVEILGTGGFSVPPTDGIYFYAALSGSVRLSGGSKKAITLLPGEVRLILSGEAHAVRTEANSPNFPLSFLRSEQFVDSPPTFTVGEGPLVARILCARLQVTWPDGIRRHELPKTLLVGDDLISEEVNVIRSDTLDLISRGAGATAMLTRMAALMLSLALRFHPQCPVLNRLSAAKDPIDRALQIIEADVATDWSVERLARCVGMSRSSFAAQFTAQVGRPPMEIITERRMRLASTFVRNTNLKLTEIGERVGYQSETAFSRRFKQYFQLSPGEMRRMFRENVANSNPLVGPQTSYNHLAHA